MSQPKFLDKIIVKDENETFGVLRNAGTIVYNKADGKAYVLLQRALSMESIASFSSNLKEMGAVSNPTITMTVGNNSGVFFGYDTIGTVYGTLDPLTLDGETVEHFFAQPLLDNLTRLKTLNASPLFDGALSLNVNVSGYGDIVLTWGISGATAMYAINDNAVGAYIESQNGNEIVFTFTIP